MGARAAPPPSTRGAARARKAMPAAAAGTATGAIANMPKGAHGGLSSARICESTGRPLAAISGRDPGPILATCALSTRFVLVPTRVHAPPRMEA